MTTKIVKNRFFVPILILLLVISCNFIFLNWSRIETLGTTAIRSSMASYSRNVVYKDHNWLVGEKIDVVYTDEDADLSKFILELSNESFKVLQEVYDFTPDARPLVAIYPSYESLLDSLGWDEDNKASGVYQSGTVKLVSPKAWYPVDILEEVKVVYRNYGPLHHEMTHLFVDYITNGNYPDWYTEALAQLEEFKLLGIEWIDQNNQNPKALYTFDHLSKDFYRLDNQALAYRQALTIGIFLEDKFGDQTHLEILEMLSKGNSFNSTINNLYGLTIIEFEEKYNNWIHVNWNNYF